MRLRVREEWINFWFYWCFPTNRAHALDLYPVCMSRTHFKQSVGELLIPQFLQVKVLNLLSQKSKLKTKTGLAEESNFIIRDTVTRYAAIWVSIAETRRCTRKVKDSSLVESCLEDLKNLKPNHEETSVVIHIYFLALHEVFTLLAYLFFCISIAFRKEK